MQIETWLRTLAEQGGSDLYLSTGAPPCAKFDGELRPIASSVMAPGEIAEVADAWSFADDSARALADRRLSSGRIPHQSSLVRVGYRRSPA